MPKLALKPGSRPPWVGLAAAAWVQIASGNTYNFPLYSSALKHVLSLNQQQVTILGVANDIGENVSFLPGFACNKLPPWALILIGSVLCVLGYGVLWLDLNQIINLPFVVLWVALCFAANGGAWLSTATLITNMRNFPFSRGTISGILKGYVGISGAVFTLIYSLLLKESASRLLLFLAIGVPFVCLALMYFIRSCAPPSGEDSSVHVHFIWVQAASVVLAIYVLVTTFLYQTISFSDTVSYILIAVMILLLMAPLAIPVKMTLLPANPKNKGPQNGSSGQLVSDDPKKGPQYSSSGQLVSDDDLTHLDPLLTPSSSAANLGSFQESENVSDIDLLLAVGEGAVRKKRKPKRGEDFKFWEAMVKADFWLLWFVYFFGVGSGVTVLNNLAQIGVALGDDNTTILLSLFSFCNFVGRLGGGVVSEHFVRSIKLPRTFWMTCTQIIMIIVFILYALALKGTLYAATALLGICYGAQFSTMVPTMSELFGLKNFGVICSVAGLGNPIGALLFSALLAGYVYDAEATKQGSSTCYGPDCYRLTFLVLAGVCGLGTMLSIILTVRIRPVYQMLYSGGSFRLPQSTDH